MNEQKTAYILFSICRNSFNPALCGVFFDKEVANQAQNKLSKHKNHTTAFIIELPVSNSLEDYMEQFRTVITEIMLGKFKK